MKKPSELFEGKNSSLRKTYEESVEMLRPKWEMEFDIWLDNKLQTTPSKDIKILKSFIESLLHSTYLQGKKDQLEEVMEILENMPVYMKVAGGDLVSPKETLLKEDLSSSLQQKLEELNK